MSYSVLLPSGTSDLEKLIEKIVSDRLSTLNIISSSSNYSSNNNSNSSSSSNSSKVHIIDQSNVKNLTSSVSSVIHKIYRPKLDFIETSEAYIMNIELPGTKRDEISIEIQNGRLIVSGNSRPPMENIEGSVRVSERHFGQFTRSIAVPLSITPDQVRATFIDGLLQVIVPKFTPLKEFPRILIA